MQVRLGSPEEAGQVPEESPQNDHEVRVPEACGPPQHHRGHRLRRMQANTSVHEWRAGYVGKPHSQELGHNTDSHSIV